MEAEPSDNCALGEWVHGYVGHICATKSGKHGFVYIRIFELGRSIVVVGI